MGGCSRSHKYEGKPFLMASPIFGRLALMDAIAEPGVIAANSAQAKNSADKKNTAHITNMEPTWPHLPH